MRYYYHPDKDGSGRGIVPHHRETTVTSSANRVDDVPPVMDGEEGFAPSRYAPWARGKSDDQVHEVSVTFATDWSSTVAPEPEDEEEDKEGYVIAAMTKKDRDEFDDPPGTDDDDIWAAFRLSVIGVIVGTSIFLGIYFGLDDNKTVDPDVILSTEAPSSTTIAASTASPKEAPSSTTIAAPTASPALDCLINEGHELRKAVDMFLEGDTARDVSQVALCNGWPIGAWDVSRVEDFSEIFAVNRNPIMKTFNWNISAWDTSSATNTSAAFAGAEAFDQDLSQWNMSRVTSMSSMFQNALAFNQNLSVWDVSKVTDLSGMFQGAETFNGDLSGWNVTRTTEFGNMFNGAVSFEGQGLSSWNPSNAKGLAGMFSSAESFIEDVSSWDVSDVQTMSGLFRNAKSFDHDISLWDITNVRQFDRMFEGATAFGQDLCIWGEVLENVEEILFEDMFNDTDCEVEADPGLYTSPLGPLCVDCYRH